MACNKRRYVNMGEPSGPSRRKYQVTSVKARNLRRLQARESDGP
jgi:hypothetical protein